MCTLDRRFSKNLKNRFSPLTDGSQQTQRTGSHSRLTVLKKPKELVLTLNSWFSRNPKNRFSPLTHGSQEIKFRPLTLGFYKLKEPCQGTYPKSTVLSWEAPLTYLFVMFSKSQNWKFLFDSEKSIKNRNKNKNGSQRFFKFLEKFKKNWNLRIIIIN